MVCVFILCDYSLHVSYAFQVHAVLPRLVLHLLDEEYSVRQACRVRIVSVGVSFGPFNYEWVGFRLDCI